MAELLSTPSGLGPSARFPTPVLGTKLIMICPLRNIYLFERGVSCTCWLAPQMPATIGGWVKLKPGPRNASQVSQVSCRDPSTGGVACCLPGCALAGSWCGRHTSQGTTPLLPKCPPPIRLFEGWSFCSCFAGIALITTFQIFFFPHLGTASSFFGTIRFELLSLFCF